MSLFSEFICYGSQSLFVTAERVYMSTSQVAHVFCFVSCCCVFFLCFVRNCSLRAFVEYSLLNAEFICRFFFPRDMDALDMDT